MIYNDHEQESYEYKLFEPELVRQKQSMKWRAFQNRSTEGSRYVEVYGWSQFVCCHG